MDKPHRLQPKAPFRMLLLLLATAMLSSGCAAGEKTLVLNGTVEADKYSVICETPGKITEVTAYEGENIKAGDIVARIDNEAQLLNVQMAEAVADLARLKLEGLRAGPEGSTLKQAESAMGAAKASVNAAKSTVTFWNNTLKALKANPVSSPGDVSNAEYQLKLAKNKLSAAQWDYTAAKSSYDALKDSASEAAATPAADTSTGRAIQAAEAELKQANASLGLSRLALSKCDVKANVDGVCLQVYLKKGDMAAQGSTIAEVIDLQKLWVDIYVPQSKLHLIKLGQELDIREMPDAKGRITNISEKAEFTPRNVETPEEKQSMVFKVKVEIAEGMDQLKPGMSIDIEIPDDVP